LTPILEELNKFGEEGWEVIYYDEEIRMGKYAVTIFMKKEIINPL